MFHKDSYSTSYFNDITGAGSPSQGVLYNPNTASVTTTSAQSVTWNNLQSSDTSIDFSKPFVITGLPGGNSASSVGTVSTVYLPPNTNLLDAYVVLNAYGADDGAIVQVKPPGGNWITVFDSFESKYTQEAIWVMVIYLQ